MLGSYVVYTVLAVDEVGYAKLDAYISQEYKRYVNITKTRSILSYINRIINNVLCFKSSAAFPPNKNLNRSFTV